MKQVEQDKAGRSFSKFWFCWDAYSGVSEGSSKFFTLMYDFGFLGLSANCY